jgi:choline dehydrogenase
MQADYVIVGAGSAGCALACRLSASGASVIVVEYGGTDAGPFIKMPGALSYPMNMKRYDWGYSSAPEPRLNGRSLVVPRGKVVGGSSSINGMVYVRGHARDYDHWAAQGATGWSGADIAPYFRRMEDWSEGGPFDGIPPADPSLRGRGGPLSVTRGPRTNPLTRAFVAAGAQAGWPITPDCNGAAQEGFGPFDMTVKNGRRWSAADAYLRPALKGGNCRLVRGLAHRVTLDGRRATGVEITPHGAPHGARTSILAAREVIVSASSINSPLLLMRSGIGPAAHLVEHGIDVVLDLPGVGGNLQDHLEVYVQQAASRPVSLFKYWNLPGKAYVGARWLLRRDGPGASNQFESGAFIRSSPAVDYPDIQMHFLPIAVRYDGQAAAEGHGFQAHVGPMRSPARGTVRLGGGADAPPDIRFDHLGDDGDRAVFRAGIRAVRKVFAQDAFAPYRGKEISPGAAAMSDDALDAFVREHAESAYHPCGSCRMGAASDPLAVVDPALRVIGIDGLRVADSSIFPRVTYGNLNAPSIMTGEKAADLILGRPAPTE